MTFIVTDKDAFVSQQFVEFTFIYSYGISIIFSLEFLECTCTAHRSTLQILMCEYLCTDFNI